ncbi:FlaD/FlaE family flagellar protein [Halovenus sp. HT40]|uniref:FlaD/FlaE family flagellar protein n=1 Tax=Halovenus sp. HT40 TaxID=3126691 RepID=UPI00300ED107
MSTTVLATSLQSVLQEPMAAGVAAVGLAAVLGVVLWVLRGSVLTSDEPAGEPISDGGTTGFAGDPPERRAAETAGGEENASDEELEHRLDELETEVDSLSSTVKTVRNENEQISESVKDIEENTGRLLNLYQMATRGVNPFASEADGPGTEAGQHTPEEESFDKEDEIEEIETDVADDSAADLFDSESTEIREEHCVDSVEEVVDSGGEPDDAFQQTKQAERSTQDQTAAESDDEVEEVEKDSFEAVFETKTPESDEQQDADEELFGTEEMIDAGGDGVGPAASDGGQLIEPTEPEQDSADAQTPDTTASTDQTTSPVPESTEPETTTESAMPAELAESTEPKTTDTETTAAVQPATDSSPTSTDLSEGKPYVDSLPDGFSSEVMTVEWLEYLVDEVGIRGTIRALEYYETIGWLTEDAVAELDGYLDAFEEPSKADLSIEHHLRSLDYVEELKHASED